MDEKSLNSSAGLSDQHRLFADNYLVSFDAVAAYVAAGYKGRGRTAESAASRILARADVRAYLAARIERISANLALSTEKVLKRLWLIATADAAEIIRVQYFCCRYCYGKGHRYQRTPREMEEYRANWEVELKKKAKDIGCDDCGILVEEFDAQGGIGYDSCKPPNVNCPECFGQGERKVVLADTDSLSEQARLLYGGVKETQHGVQVVMEDRLAALVNVGRHLGMFKDNVEMTGKDGKPIEHEHVFFQQLFESLGFDNDTGIGPSRRRRS